MLLTNKLPVYYPKMILSIANSKVHCNAVLIHTLWNETSFQSADPAYVQIEEMNNKIATFPYLSSCYIIQCIHVVKFIITHLLFMMKCSQNTSSCFDNHLHG